MFCKAFNVNTVFTLLYFIVGHWLYTQKIAGICSGDATTIVAPPVDDPPDDDLSINNNAGAGVLTFNWSDQTPITSDNFEAYQNEILNGLEDDKDLEILKRVQSDARLTAEALGYEIGLSPPAVQKRLQKLRQ